jgi:Transient receptor potential (TRP) ion channel
MFHIFLEFNGTDQSRYNLNRILTTALGIIIIVIQGFLVIALLILIIIGAFSTYFSITRNKAVEEEEAVEDYHWTPSMARWLRQKKTQYLPHIQQRATDVPLPPKIKLKKTPFWEKVQKPVLFWKERTSKIRPAAGTEISEQEKKDGFIVNGIRRVPKIEDEDEQDDDQLGTLDEINHIPGGSGSNRTSRANSLGAASVISIGNAPYGARVHRASWSTREFQQQLNAMREERTTSGVFTADRVRSPDSTPRTSIVGAEGARRHVSGTPSRQRIAPGMDDPSRPLSVASVGGNGKGRSDALGALEGTAGTVATTSGDESGATNPSHSIKKPRSNGPHPLSKVVNKTKTWRDAE